MTTWGHQAVVLLRIGLVSMSRHAIRAGTTVVGAAGGVAMLVGVLSIAEGYLQVMQTGAGDESVLVMMDGATAEVASTISGDAAGLVRRMPGIATLADGAPAFSAELFTTAKFDSRHGQPLNMAVRGVDPAGYVLSGIKLVEGRLPQAGRRELIVGARASGRLRQGDIGDVVDIAGAQWTVVGRFTADSGLTESEIWTDAPTLAAAMERGSAVQVLHLRLVRGMSLDRFSRQLRDDPRLQLRAIDHAQYLADQSHALRTFLYVLCYGVSLLMALGAAFAALGTSYASVNARIREIGTLKALGFTDGAIFAALVAESVLLTCLGGALGALLAYAVFDGVQTSTFLHSSNYSQVAFSFSVTAQSLVQAAVLATLIGIAGSLYPAWTVLKLNTATALAERR
ncbi:ABC transporter permease [Xanthomonas sp. MUS 060]|uniref:ABC transporter permease n=1 Tax=Xanthomonas sp. MUS 060 TaxID=1588031 RepID=UPI0006965DC8|nr:ABC transporter permease [Xanthomonas sp. MUS 060]